MTRLFVALGTFAAAALLFWQFPLFHIVSLEEFEAARTAESFDAREYAKDFWVKKLVPHFAEAVDAAEVVAALRRDPQQARREFGRTVGLSRSTLLIVRGQGTITSVDRRTVGVALVDGATEPDVALVVGPVVGNAVRDASGLLSTGDFADSQHFNELATELNRLAEEGPVTDLRSSAEVGRTVEFVACGEIVGGRIRWPLKLIPVSATVE
jgi:predicted lipoprotein